GFETARLIRTHQRCRHTPIIFLTAHEEGPSVEEAYALGAVDYLVKPLVPAVLRAKVAVFVELFHKAEQIKRQAEQLRQIEQREFERKLAEENARFRALTEHSTDAVSLVSPDGTVIYSSPANRHVLGYDTEQTTGRSSFEYVHPDHQERVRHLFVQLV